MMRNMIKKYREIIPYLFFGVCTTIINVIVYWGSAHLFGMSTMLSTILAWMFAVLFAYVTNRKWVFHSKVSGIKAILTEMVSFFSCRLATGVVDWLCMYVFVDILQINDVLIKIVANILVIILNYVASKLLIFKNRSEQTINVKRNHSNDTTIKIGIIFVCTIAAIFIGYHCTITTLTYKEYKSFGSVEDRSTSIELEKDGDQLSQTFTMPYDILNSIGVMIGTFGKDNNSEWNVFLYESESNKEVYQGHFNASLMSDNEYYEIKMGKNLRVKRNQEYTVIIQARNVNSSSKLAFYIDLNSDTEGNILCHTEEEIPGQLVTRIYGGNVDYWWFGMYGVIILIIFFTAVRIVLLISENKKPLEDKIIQAMIVGFIFFVLKSPFSVAGDFIDENDNIRGGLVIANGGVLYKDYIVQHTPVMYYMCSIFALLGANSVSQFRLSYYLLEAVIWVFTYIRYSGKLGKRVALVPILEVICISSVTNPQGYQIVSDDWQGMMFVILLLEFLIYYKERTLDWHRCIIVSICIWGSFGAAFVSTYSLIFLVVVVFALEVIYWKKTKFSIGCLIQRYYKLLISIVVPFIGAIIYFQLNGALRQAYDQCYAFNRQVYPKYNGGMGDKIIQPFIGGIQSFFGIVSDNFNAIVTSTATNITIFQLVIIVMAIAILIKQLEKKKYLESVTIFLMMIFAATRGYGFHGMAAWYIAVMVVAINVDIIKTLLPRLGIVAISLVGIVLTSTYVDEVGNYILYEIPSVSELEANVVELTEKDENKDIFLDAYSYDSLYFFYKDRKSVNPAAYMLPWYMDWYEQDNIAALTEQMPRVVVYKTYRNCWGYTYYSNNFDEILQESYTRLGDENSGWKYNVWIKNE